MKTFVIIIAAFLSFQQSTFAQSPKCDCKSDLDFVVSKLKKTPSYKKQLKDGILSSFEETYDTISSKLQKPIAIEECFKLLQKQIVEVDDFHLGLYFNHEYFSEKDLKDSLKIQSILNSSAFLNHPTTSENIEELISRLKKSKVNSIEGIYVHSASEIKVGILEKANNMIEGVILSKNNPFWKKGQIILSGYKNKFGKYDLLTYRITNKKLRMINNITFENGRLLNLKKVGNNYNFEFLSDKKANWYYEQLTEDIQYVYFGSFSSFSVKNRKAFKVFYEKYKNRFNTKNIIVDLRSNGGGNSKFSDPFLKLFKRSKANIFILTNSFTGSNSEQFTLKLKEIKGAKHLGQATFGLLAYGNNKGSSFQTPSGYFNFSPTDMNFHKYISHEGYGVVPDEKLDFSKDWIEQTKQIIRAK